MSARMAVPSDCDLWKMRVTLSPAMLAFRINVSEKTADRYLRDRGWHFKEGHLTIAPCSVCGRQTGIRDLDAWRACPTCEAKPDTKSAYEMELARRAAA